MSRLYESNEVNETAETAVETEFIDADFEAELDSKCDEYASEERSLQDIQRDKEKLHKLREKLMEYKEANESDSSDEDEDPERVLKLTRHR